MKHCYKCKQTKKRDLFNKNKWKKDGLADECRECNVSKLKKWTQENKESLKNKDKIRNKNPIRREQQRIYSQKRKQKLRRENLSLYQLQLEIGKCRMYGITLERYNEMLDSQKNVCAICEKPETASYSRNGIKKTKKLAIDHSHETGLVRGLLCQNCNILVGCSKDSPILLAKIINYLKTYS